MTAFFDMNGYGIYIWPCYVLTALLVGGLYWHSHAALKKARAQSEVKSQSES